MQRHVQDTLIANGVMTSGFITRKAKYRHCPRGCGLIVLTAIDDIGFTTTCDPHPTTTLGELQALLAGRRTYTTVGEELVYRAAHRIVARDTDREPVYVQHECGIPPPPTNELHVKRKCIEYTSEECPF